MCFNIVEIDLSSSTNATVSDSPFCCTQECAKATVEAVSTSWAGYLTLLQWHKRENESALGYVVAEETVLLLGIAH